MNFLRNCIVAGGLVTGLVIGWYVVRPFISAPEVAYELLEQTADYEVRQYAPMAGAQTMQCGTVSEAVSKGFRVLADYIFAKNGATYAKISMTAPVLFSPECDGVRVRFVLPSGMTEKNAPKPLNSDVEVCDFCEATFAVMDVLGAPSEEEWQTAEADLRAMLKESEWRATSKTWFARYNPPWIPKFMRRNEVWVACRKR